MGLKEFCKPVGVRAALIAATALFVVTGMTILYNRCELAQENKNLKSLAEKQSSKIQELEFELTPFKTVALEKFTGTTKEALGQLADYIIALQTNAGEARNPESSPRRHEGHEEEASD